MSQSGLLCGAVDYLVLRIQHRFFNSGFICFRDDRNLFFSKEFLDHARTAESGTPVIFLPARKMVRHFARTAHYDLIIFGKRHMTIRTFFAQKIIQFHLVFAPVFASNNLIQWYHNLCYYVLMLIRSSIQHAYSTKEVYHRKAKKSRDFAVKMPIIKGFVEFFTYRKSSFGSFFEKIARASFFAPIFFRD